MNSNSVYLFGPDAQSDEERSKILSSVGPQIDVFVSNPLMDATAGMAKKSKSVRALIDTGASLNSISISVARTVGLMKVDERPVSQVSGKVLMPVFHGKVYVPKLEHSIVGEFYGGQPGSMGMSYQVLLGTPFLKRYIFNYDGPRGYFSLRKSDISGNWADIV